MNEKARKRFADMRIGCHEAQPYLGHFAYGMEQVMTDKIPAMAVDNHGNIYWNPDWVMNNPVSDGAYVVAHEMIHVALSHAERSKVILDKENGIPRDKRQLALNIAWDLVVEQTLSACRDIRPDGAVQLGIWFEPLQVSLDFPENLRGEEYYRLIIEQMQGGGNGGDGEECEDGESGEGDGGESGDGKGQGSGDSDNPLSPENAGSGSDGVPRDYEVPPDDYWETVGKPSTMLATEKKIEDEIAAKGQGAVPGNVVKEIASYLKPVRDPFERFQSQLESDAANCCGKRKQTRTRHCRKQPVDAQVLPLHGLKPNAASCVVIVDTSGSMQFGETQERIRSVLEKGLKKFDSIKVRCFDTELAGKSTVTSLKDFKFKGGGGTDMTKAIEVVCREDRPDALVMVTDCITDWPTKQPSCRVTVAATENNNYVERVPRWANVCRLVQEGE